MATLSTIRDSDRNPRAADIFRKAVLRNDVEMLRTALQMDKGLVNQLVQDPYYGTIPPLVLLVKKKSPLELVQELLNHQADVNAAHRFGATAALLPAVVNDNLEAAQLLLKYGANVEQEDSAGFSPLLYAQSVEMAQLLVTHGADVNRAGRHGYSPLDAAVARGDKEWIMLLVEHGADIHASGRWGSPCLHRATFSFELTQYLLQRGADVNARSTDGKTPLHDCSDPQVARLLLQYGADVNATNIKGNTPFFEACCYNRIVIAQLMINHGADLTIDGEWALVFAATSKELDVVRFLLELGIDANATRFLEQWPRQTPPLQATFRTHTGNVWYIKKKCNALLVMLLNYGADINARERDTGRTLLHQVSMSIYPSLVELLVQNGADIHARDNQGWTPVLLAARERQWNVVKALVKHGAIINDCADSVGARTPLSVACLESHWYRLQALQDLLDAGACVDYTDQDGSTPLLHAVKNDHLKRAVLLLQRGADIHARNKEDTTPFLVACGGEKGGLDMLYPMIRFSPHHCRPQPI